jgi:hypothetical protein
LFPATRGGHMELNKWRTRAWVPALRAAGLYTCPECERTMETVRRGVYGCGVSLFALSRRMGTSLAMIDATYGYLAPDAEDRERELLDAYDAAASDSDEVRSSR